MAHHLPCFRLIVAGLAAVAWLAPVRQLSGAENAQRTNLVQAILSEDFPEQRKLLQKLSGADDPFVQQALIAWRGGAVYLLDTHETKSPFLLDSATDSDGNAKGIRILDGNFLKGADGQPSLF